MSFENIFSKKYFSRQFNLQFSNFLEKGKFDFERIIDDFIFLCFFVGNDFLPTLPTLKIREGALDTLLRIYKSILEVGYLTVNGEVILERVEVFLARIAENEEDWFKNNGKGKKNKITKTDFKERVWEEFEKRRNTKFEEEKGKLFCEIEEFLIKENKGNYVVKEKENVFLHGRQDNDKNEEKFVNALNNLNKVFCLLFSWIANSMLQKNKKMLLTKLD